MTSVRQPWDKKKEAVALIRHYVIGGYPGKEAIEDSGAPDQIGYYAGILTTIMGWSGLSLNEVKIAIEVAPDVIENNIDKQNF